MGVNKLSSAGHDSKRASIRRSFMIKSLIRALITIATWEILKFKIRRGFKKVGIAIKRKCRNTI